MNETVTAKVATGVRVGPADIRQHFNQDEVAALPREWADELIEQGRRSPEATWLPAPIEPLPIGKLDSTSRARRSPDASAV
jgi:hypothetical protein